MEKGLGEDRRKSLHSSSGLYVPRDLFIVQLLREPMN